MFSFSLVSPTLGLVTSVFCSSRLSELSISLSLETNLLAVEASALAKAASFNNCSFLTSVPCWRNFNSTSSFAALVSASNCIAKASFREERDGAEDDLDLNDLTDFVFSDLDLSIS